jgi:hypothetical protein
MLGWRISVYRQKGGGASPASACCLHGARIAVWQTDWDGLDWINELVEANRAINLSGNGYPCRYTGTAEHILPRILNGPPAVKLVWTCDEFDILTEEREGRTVIDVPAAKQCRPDEWLLVEAWDES